MADSKEHTKAQIKNNLKHNLKCWYPVIFFHISQRLLIHLKGSPYEESDLRETSATET